MRFVRYGRTYQLEVTSVADLADVLSLDESKWAATSAPATAYRCDAKFLKLLDTEGNGRINSDEIKAAIRWLLAQLRDPAQIPADTDEMPLAAVNPESPSGQTIIEAAAHLLATTGAEADDRISLAQVRHFQTNLQSQPVNGDGVIVPEAAADPQLAAFIADVMKACPGQQDVSGRAGINEKQLDDFAAAVPAYLKWKRTGRLPADSTAVPELPLGAETPAIHAVYAEHAAKVDLFFKLCRLKRYDPRTSPRLAGLESRVQELDPADPAAVDTYLAGLPVANPNEDGLLPLDEQRVNPAFREWFQSLRATVLPAVLTPVPEQLTETDWQQVKNVLAPYEGYLAQQTGAFVGVLPDEQLERYRAPAWTERTRELIATDKRVASIAEGVAQLERLLLCRRHLVALVNNFVSFPALYASDERALFEMGSVVMDGRRFSFAVKVDDVASHSVLAKTSQLFVMYMEITGGDKPFTVAVPATSGTKGNLSVGKRGVFFDVDRREYDARVLQIIENPVSLREALAAPFVRLWRLAEGKIEAWSGSAEKSLQTEFNQTLAASTQAATPPAAAAPAAAPEQPRGNFLFGMGVVVAALGSSFAFVTKTLSAMPRHQVLLGLLCTALAVMLPVSLIAVLKLRRQDLSALLEGCGWAVNVRMRLSRTQRRFFTREVAYPANAAGTPRRHGLLFCVLSILVALLVWLWLLVL